MREVRVFINISLSEAIKITEIVIVYVAYLCVRTVRIVGETPWNLCV